MEEKLDIEEVIRIVYMGRVLGIGERGGFASIKGVGSMAFELEYSMITNINK